MYSQKGVTCNSGEIHNNCKYFEFELFYYWVKCCIFLHSMFNMLHSNTLISYSVTVTLNLIKQNGQITRDC